MQRRGSAMDGGSAVPALDGDGRDGPTLKLARGIVRRYMRQKLGPVPVPLLVLVLLFVWILVLRCTSERPEPTDEAKFLRLRGSDVSDAAPEPLPEVNVGQLTVPPPASKPEPPSSDAAAAAAGAAAAAAATPVRGVAPELRIRYEDRIAAGGFECLDGSASVSGGVAVLNDDFCDCADGSDEPGTAACAGLRTEAPMPEFSCGWQLSPEKLSSEPVRSRTIHRSSVNDGICDCCGGEDEWDSEAMCKDRCGDLLAEESAHAAQALAGSKAREVYVKQAVALKDDSRYSGVDGGPDGVFLAAAAAGCLTLDDDGSSYEVCLFKHVMQRSSGGSFKLGSQGDWATTLWEDGKTHRKDYSKLIMGHGEYCAPANAHRRAELLLECGTTPRILGVQETQVCIYTFRVQTPAACHSLAHHHH